MHCRQVQQGLEGLTHRSLEISTRQIYRPRQLPDVPTISAFSQSCTFIRQRKEQKLQKTLKKIEASKRPQNGPHREGRPKHSQRRRMSSPNLVARNIKSLPPLFISLHCIATITMMKPTIIDPNGLTGYSASFHGLVIMGDISPLGYNGGHFQGSFETTIRPVQRFSGQNGCVLFKLTLCAMCNVHATFSLFIVK